MTLHYSNFIVISRVFELHGITEKLFNVKKEKQKNNNYYEPIKFKFIVSEHL